MLQKMLILLIVVEGWGRGEYSLNISLSRHNWGNSRKPKQIELEEINRTGLNLFPIEGNKGYVVLVD